jgi:hypothetical protein
MQVAIEELLGEILALNKGIAAKVCRSLVRLKSQA